MVQGFPGQFQGPRSRRAMRPPRRRRHPLLRLLRFIVLLAVLFLVVQAALNPWAFRIGGTFTPTMSWQGFGTVSASNRGHYVLYAQFRGGLLSGNGDPACSQLGCENLSGTARLCTSSGTTYTFPLTGEVKAWLNTDGSATNLDLTDGTPKSLPDGWVVALHGIWHGPALALHSPDNSFTEVFTPQGAIRSTTSTADAGTATVTLRPGTVIEFNQACHAIAQGT